MDLYKDFVSEQASKELEAEQHLPGSRVFGGTFSSHFFHEVQTTISDEIEGKIIALYSMGMNYCDISSCLQDMYGLELSIEALTSVTDKIIESVKAWQSQSLEAIYPIVWLDADYTKIREEGKVCNRALYKVLGVNLEGGKEALGLYVRWSSRIGQGSKL